MDNTVIALVVIAAFGGIAYLVGHTHGAKGAQSGTVGILGGGTNTPPTGKPGEQQPK